MSIIAGENLGGTGRTVPPKFESLRWGRSMHPSPNIWETRYAHWRKHVM